MCYGAISKVNYEANANILETINLNMRVFREYYWIFLIVRCLVLKSCHYLCAPNGKYLQNNTLGPVCIRFVICNLYLYLYLQNLQNAF